QYNLRTLNRRTILFVDEIHRFNKNQQDALLPFVEDGTVTLIGATTENPSFELNSALLSRAPIFVLKTLEFEALIEILKRAATDPVEGLGLKSQQLPESLFRIIAQRANGDARRALGILEDFHVYALSELSDASPLTNERASELLEKSVGQKFIRYDARGEEHYNTISAFIKSLRDSDPDAALYYLARMLEAGEEPLFIARRMVIFASEDIGNAEPRGLQVALAVKEAVDFVGMPEARINLAHGVTFLAACPKSNASYVGIESALEDVRNHGNLEIPLHLRNAPTRFMKDQGYGKNYQYAHDFEDGITEQVNLPEQLNSRRYYQPKPVGLEKSISDRLLALRTRKKPQN
ncbi:MAG TPA: replication-associated recombination protein A, partial [Oligoflexia bacterium]|nr:replication-associated recombination protein A [Oligoflexia bacterium]